MSSLFKKEKDAKNRKVLNQASLVLFSENKNFNSCYINIKQKEKIFPKICKKFNVLPSDVAYIGDDLNDLKIMNLVGLTACPSNAEKEIQLISDYKCKKSGGNGVFREFANILLDDVINS